jgi:glycine hydroxymethyltransferase
MDITGQQAETALESVGIITNKNAIPFDPKPPRVASGMRLGTPAITSRGFGEAETGEVSRLITRLLNNLGNQQVMGEVKGAVKEITSGFPVPGLDS